MSREKLVLTCRKEECVYHDGGHYCDRDEVALDKDGTCEDYDIEQ